MSGITKNDIDYVLIDVSYALRQLRQFRCVDRAIDGLERVESTLKDYQHDLPVTREEADGQ